MNVPEVWNFSALTRDNGFIGRLQFQQLLIFPLLNVQLLVVFTQTSWDLMNLAV